MIFTEYNDLWTRHGPGYTLQIVQEKLGVLLEYSTNDHRDIVSTPLDSQYDHFPRINSKTTFIHRLVVKIRYTWTEVVDTR